MGTGRALLIGLLLALVAAPAAAEFYRCVGPDGKTRYTSRPEGCPGEQPHTLRGELQRVPSTRRVGRTPASRQRSAQDTAGHDEARAAQWKAKRSAAERERRHLQSEVEPWRQLVKSCNQGGTLFVKEKRSGLKRSYECDEARAQHEKMLGRLAELDAYLDRGIEEECRRAGCLPGWVR